MLIHESVQTCATCGETTPHSRRVIALPKLFAAAVLVAAISCFLQTGFLWIVGGMLLVLALFVTLQDRDRHWNVACERCRGKRVDEVRATRPRLGSTTIIDF